MFISPKTSRALVSWIIGEINLTRVRLGSVLRRTTKTTRIICPSVQRRRNFVGCLACLCAIPFSFHFSFCLSPSPSLCGSPLRQAFENRMQASKGTISTRMEGGNPLQLVQSKMRELDVQVKSWMKKQSAPVEVALVTAGSAVQGGAIGALMGTFTADMASSLPTATPGLNPQTAASLQQAKVGFSLCVCMCFSLWFGFWGFVFSSAERCCMCFFSSFDMRLCIDINAKTKTPR